MKTEKYTLCCSSSFFIQEKICSDWGVLVSPDDCAYYGAWACPVKLETLSYTEGDICHKTEMTPEEFVADILSNRRFHEKEGGWLWIDCRESKSRLDLFTKLGLGSMTTKDKGGGGCESFILGAGGCPLCKAGIPKRRVE